MVVHHLLCGSFITINGPYRYLSNMASVKVLMFAPAALEQVDEALSQKDKSSGRDFLNESTTSIKGCLWANVFKFALDLDHL